MVCDFTRARPRPAMMLVVGALVCLLPRSLLLAGAVGMPELGSWPSCSGQCVQAAGQPQGSAGETRLPDSPLLGNGDLGASIGVMWSGVPGRVDHSGGLRIHQPRRGDLHSDAPLPRRVGFGDFSIAAAGLGGGNFTATQDIENAVVWARVQKEGVGWLAASIRLAPDENTALVDVQSWWEKPTLVGVNASALPLRTLCRRGDSQQPPGPGGGGMCIEMDGSAQDGCINGSAWAARSPFSADLSCPLHSTGAAISPQHHKQWLRCVPHMPRTGARFGWVAVAMSGSLVSRSCSHFGGGSSI
jgi:hypothetical protein